MTHRRRHKTMCLRFFMAEYMEEGYILRVWVSFTEDYEITEDLLKTRGCMNRGSEGFK